MLEAIALALVIAHFSFPLAYYSYAKKFWLRRPWGIRFDDKYRPKITVVIPTYNEAAFIARRLNNVYEQDYPKELLEVIVVDGASVDGTPEIVNEWTRKYKDVRVVLLRESERRGKAADLNRALRHAGGDIVIVADADALWECDALSKAARLFGDPSVGAVSCIKRPVGGNEIEESYRWYYNTLRVAESRAYSTPIFHGELAAFRRELIEKVGGFPVDVGADDSHAATEVVALGYRSIVREDVVCAEVVPAGMDYHSWRLRRAQHLLQHFTKALRKLHKYPKQFRPVLLAEAYLHAVNPWILASAVLLLLVAAALGSGVATISLLAGAALLVLRPYRTWVIAQLYLIAGTVKNIKSKELAWTKQVKALRTI